MHVVDSRQTTLSLAMPPIGVDLPNSDIILFVSYAVNARFVRRLIAECLPVLPFPRTPSP